MGNYRCPNCGSANVGTTTEYKAKKALAMAGDFVVGFGAARLFGAEAAQNLLSETGAVSDNIEIAKELECKSCGFTWEEGTERLTSNQNMQKAYESQDAETETETEAEADYQGLVLDAAYQVLNNPSLDLRDNFSNLNEGYKKDILQLIMNCFESFQWPVSIINTFSIFKDISDYLENEIDYAKARLSNELFESFKMTVEDVFPIEGRGVVITGQIEDGVILIGDEVYLHDGTDSYNTTVVGIEMFQRIWLMAEYGDDVGLLLRGVSKDVIKKGMVVNKIKEIPNLPSTDTNHTMDATSTSTNKHNEKEYVESLKDCLAEGKINEHDRRVLDRLRKSLGISEDRAKALEASLSAQVTDEEKEYLDSVKDYLAEGEINERDRRMLERLRKSLDISEERAIELEAMV